MPDNDDDERKTIEAIVAPKKVAAGIAGAAKALVIAGASAAMGQFDDSLAFLVPVMAEVWASVVSQRVDRVQDHQRSVQQLLEARVREAIEGQENAAKAISEIKERLANAEARAVLFNYAEQAYREPTEKRVPLIDHAAAGIVDVRLSIAEHSRVERTIRELDPDDVMALDRLARCAGHTFDGVRYEYGGATYAFWQSLASADVLVTTGCVRLVYGGMVGVMGSVHSGRPAAGNVHITKIGEQVLSVCRSFILVRRDPFSSPGRENFPGSRTEAEARELLDRLGSVVETLQKLARTRRPRFDPATWRGADEKAMPPPPDTIARLSFEGVEQRVAQRLIGALPKDSLLRGEILGPPGEFRELRFSGPHDVLRWLADDLDANWVA